MLNTNDLSNFLFDFVKKFDFDPDPESDLDPELPVIQIGIRKKSYWI